MRHHYLHALRAAASSRVTPLSCRVSLAALLALASGCHKAPPTEGPNTDEPTAHITANDVEFSQKNPQLGSLQTVVARAVNQEGESFTGQITWDENSTDRVYSPVAGQVERIIGQIGQTVKKGDDLALMHSSDFGQAQADYRKALGDFAQFDKTLARVKMLNQHGAASQKDVESAQADFDRGQAEKERAEANLQLLGTTSGNFNDVYHLISPIDGVIVDKNINVGQQIRADLILANTPQATAPLFTITDPTKLWVLLDVPETRLGRLRLGETVELRSPAYPGRVFPGRIEDVGAFLDPATRVAHARAAVDNPGGLLKNGMYISVVVKEEASSTVTDIALPPRSVVYQDGQYYVFVEVSPGKFTRRQVTLERESGPDGTGDAVVRGIKAGQVVVSEGSLLINELMADKSENAGPAVPPPGPSVQNGDSATPDATPRPL